MIPITNKPPTGCTICKARFNADGSYSCDCQERLQARADRARKARGKAQDEPAEHQGLSSLEKVLEQDQATQKQQAQRRESLKKKS